MNASATDNLTAAGATSAQAHKSLRTAADELVGEVFYGTLLRQMRDSSLKGKYGHGGRGEEIFQGQLDSVLAARAGRAGGAQLADAIVDRFERNAEAAAQYRATLKARLDELQSMSATAPAAATEAKE